jgi:spore germination protein KB
MTNHKITGKQLESIFVLFLIGSTAITAVDRDAKQDSWISLLMSVIAALPLIALYVRLNKLYPGKNFFDILFSIFGGVVGRIIAIIFIVYVIRVGGILTWFFAQFVHVLGMVETPLYLTSAFIIMTGIWAAKNGPECIGRLSKFTLPIILFSIGITFIIAIKDMNFSYMKPVMETDFKSLLSGAFAYLMIPLGEIIICFSFLACADDKVNPSKIYLRSILLFFIFILVALLRNILVLGVPTTIMFYFPSYEAVSVISLGGFFTRIEVLIGINLLLAGFIKITACLYTASLGITKVINIQDQKKVAVPTGLLILASSQTQFKNTVEGLMFVKPYSVFVTLFEILLPLIVWAVAEFRAKINSTQTQATGLDSAE